jgi:hypothetical protein
MNSRPSHRDDRILHQESGGHERPNGYMPMTNTADTWTTQLELSSESSSIPTGLDESSINQGRQRTQPVPESPYERYLPSEFPQTVVKRLQTQMLYRFLRYFISWSPHSNSLKTPKRPERNPPNAWFCPNWTRLPQAMTKWLLVLAGLSFTSSIREGWFYHLCCAAWGHLALLSFTKLLHLLSQLLPNLAKVPASSWKCYHFPKNTAKMFPNTAWFSARLGMILVKFMH